MIFFIKNFNSLLFRFIFGIKLQILNQNHIRYNWWILNKWQLWPKNVTTQILQCLYNFISILVRNICWLIVANISSISPLADNSFRSLAATTPYPAAGCAALSPRARRAWRPYEDQNCCSTPMRPAGVTPLWRSELFFSYFVPI